MPKALGNAFMSCSFSPPENPLDFFLIIKITPFPLNTCPLADWNPQSEQPLDVRCDGERDFAVVQDVDGVIPAALGVLDLRKKEEFSH